jgi:DNA-binding PadR family transcriptional regulator
VSTTSYALLGLLILDPESSDAGMTGYELKQRADRTLRFYWTSPAMSQIYTELDRLDEHGYVSSTEAQEGKRTTRRFTITAAGRRALNTWLLASDADLPVLKHPIAMRLMLGSLMGADAVEAMLATYVDQLVEIRAELQEVRDRLGDIEQFRFPARVAEWGLSFYDNEADIVARLRKEISASPDATPPRRSTE